MTLRAPGVKRLWGLLPPIAALGAWEFAVQAGLLRHENLPLPSEIFAALQQLLHSGALFSHLAASMLRVFAGYLIALTLALPLGLLMGCSEKTLLLMRPTAEMLRTVSPIAWIPLAILWFGIGNIPAIFIISITCFFPMLVTTINAVQTVDPLYRKIARDFGASRAQELYTVIIPAALPPIAIGLRISLGIAWLVIVAAEMVGMRSGLGYLISDSRNMLRTDLVMASMIVIGAAGCLLDSIMRRLEQYLPNVALKTRRPE